MVLRNRFLFVVGGIGLASLVAATAWAESREAPRDEALFVEHVSEFFDGRVPERPRLRVNQIDALVAEGDRACGWLAGKPAQFDDAFRPWRLYFQEMPASPDWPFPEGDPADTARGVVVYDAWAFLCPEVRDEHIWVGPPGEYD